MAFLMKNYTLTHEGRGTENSIFLELLKNKKHPHDEVKTYKKLNSSEIDFIYHYTSGDLLPIEVKSGNRTTIPRIFYSFATEYPEITTYIKTTNSFSVTKNLAGTHNKVIFSPNRNISNCL